MTPEHLAVLKAWLDTLPTMKCNGCTVCARKAALTAAIGALEAK